MGSSFIILYTIHSFIIISYFNRASAQLDLVKIDANTVFNETRSIFPNGNTLASPSHEVVFIPNFCKHKGYYRVKQTHDARMFHFFYESRGRKSDPLVLWLTGGPGHGCATNMFSNGPYLIGDDLTLKWNDFGWDKVSNILYVDQPTGTGFSFSSDGRDTRHNTNEIIIDLYHFLEAFFEAHPEFLKNDFYITGNSYAGHFIPVLSSYIRKANKAKTGIQINLKGLAIANGYNNPEYQFSSYLDFALMNKLISTSYYKELKTLNFDCVKSIKHCQIDHTTCGDAHYKCKHNYELLLNVMGDVYPYDIRKQRTYPGHYDIVKIYRFMTLNPVKTALNVGNKEYKFDNREVYEAMSNDFMRNYAVVVPQLLDDDIKVLIYDGECDLICNWLGNLRWLNAMKWNGHDKFSKTKLSSFKVDGEKVGQIKQTGSLTYVKVHNAGHNIAHDQPKVALQLLKNLLNN